MGTVKIGTGLSRFVITGFDDDDLQGVVETFAKVVRQGGAGFWLTTASVEVEEGGNPDDAEGEGVVWVPVTTPISFVFEGNRPKEIVIDELPVGAVTAGEPA